MKRVVLTSSFAAIGYGQKPRTEPFTEKDWTDPNGPDISVYAKSKTLAEWAAWDFISREGGALELAVVNAVGVFGPVLGPDYSTSVMFVQRFLDGTVSGAPRISFGVVDVRDVADLHLCAMTNPAAKGKRFLAVDGEFITVGEIARLLKTRMGAAGARVATRVLPDGVLRLAAIFDKSIGLVVPELEKTKRATNEKAKRILGWTPRPNEEAIIATGESLVRLGLLKNQKKAA